MLGLPQGDSSRSGKQPVKCPLGQGSVARFSCA
jgi:hypothetical protein